MEKLVITIAPTGNVPSKKLNPSSAISVEDMLKFDHDTLATNLMMVERAVDIAKMLGREIATPAEARKILNLV